MSDAEIKCLRTMKNVTELHCDLSNPRIGEAVFKFHMKHDGKSPESILDSAKASIKACQTPLTSTGDIDMDPTGLGFFSSDKDGNYWTDGHVFFAVAHDHFIPIFLTKKPKENVTLIDTATLSPQAMKLSPMSYAALRAPLFPTPGASSFEGYYKQNSANTSTELACREFSSRDSVNGDHVEEIISALEDMELKNELSRAPAVREDTDTDSTDDDEEGGARL